MRLPVVGGLERVREVQREVATDQVDVLDAAVVTTKSEFTGNEGGKPVTSMRNLTGNDVRGNSAARPDRARLALLCVAQFVVVLDVTIVAIALPAIGDDLGVSRDRLQWVHRGLHADVRRAADAGGPRRGPLRPPPRVRAGLAAFGAASLACGLAPTASALVAARAGRGRRGAPAVRAGAAGRDRAGGAARTRALAAGRRPPGRRPSGWVLGGAPRGGLGWHWVFAVNVPVGLAGAALAGPAAAGSRSPAPARLDVPRRAALDAGVGASCSGLAAARRNGLAPS